MNAWGAIDLNTNLKRLFSTLASGDSLPFNEYSGTSLSSSVTVAASSIVFKHYQVSFEAKLGLTEGLLYFLARPPLYFYAYIMDSNQLFE